MPPSYADAVVPFPSSRANTQPFLVLSRLRSGVDVPAPLTAFRPKGVGGPTRHAILHRPFNPLVARAIGLAFERLDGLERRARDTARAFRTADLADAKQRLAELIHGAQAMVELVATAAESIGVDLDAIGGDCQPASQMTRRAAQRLMAHQTKEDWRSLAWTIERHLIVALAAWRLVLLDLDAVSSPGPSGYSA